MTPEERFNRIENLLHTITELQARHEDAIVRHDVAIERLEAVSEKQNAGIQDLIRVSRILLDSHTRTQDAIQSLSGTVDTLAGTVNTLAAQVDMLAQQVDMLTQNVNRFIAGLQKPNGNH